MLSESDVRWAYKYYFDRPPEDAAALAWHRAAYPLGPDQLRDSFYASAEAQARRDFAAGTAEFCVWRPHMPKLVVAGNCMGPNLGRVAAGMAPVSVYGVDILTAKIAEPELLALMDAADHVLLPLLGHEFGALASDKAGARFGGKVRFYSLPYFSGLHPDLTYLGARGQRIQSPVGDYHSRAVLRAYLAGQDLSAGLPQIEAQAALPDDAKRIWAASKKEFLRREQQADVKIGRWFFRQLRRVPLLYTINHPTALVFEEILRQAFRLFGIAPLPRPASLAQSALAGGVIWPVHRDLARRLRLFYATNDVIYAENHAMSFSEFARRAWHLYDLAGRDAVRAAAHERGLE